LADRVILMEKGRIARQMTVGLPRPRLRGPEFARLETEVLAWIMSLFAGFSEGRQRAPGNPGRAPKGAHEEA
jgi:hypothetical protein